MNNATNRRALGAPGTIQVGGRLLLVSPLTPAEELSVEYEFRRQLLEEAKTPLQQIAADLALLTPEHAQVAITAAVAQQAGSKDCKAEPTPEAVRYRLFHPAGCSFRLWMLARRNHPGLTLAEVADLVAAGSVQDILADLWLAFGGSADDDEKKADAPPSGVTT